ncbi:thioesterase family protein [Diplodia corticola]|uniref:Thioesterase family protein n=1 Tax=Diplodia corticola TaxID=236234 RepID=A0A1J9SHL6_9PEZI|nr:thioesterase family protein [Diplodia corticola]OJD39085.1 thioesterase family protein [Diplodia corticola]
MASANADGRAKAMRAVQALFDRYKLIAAQRPHGHVDFDSEVMNKMKLVDAGPEGFVQFELTIGNEFSNLNDVMHGGAAGVIFDMATTSALNPLSRPDFWFFMGGVTRTLNISYLRAVPLGTTVLLTSRVVQVGKTMAMIKGDMTSLDGSIVYATAEHHKVNVSLNNKHAKFRIPWDDEIEAEVKREEELEMKGGKHAKL